MPPYLFSVDLFQSTCLREARLPANLPGGYPARFQSTCLREARLRSIGTTRLYRYFNPRAYVRHDDHERQTCIEQAFQSTCLREARPR